MTDTARNASSLPPRLPYLSRILKAAASRRGNDTEYSIVALSYRGFWTSKGRPSQPGIELDGEAALNWVFSQNDLQNTKIVVWGQSIGAGAATVSLSNFVRADYSRLQHISGLLLETPFVDLRHMLVAMYPQKFLPYHYLAPFLRSTWDSKTALQEIGQTTPTGLKILILEAGSDEIVPAGQASILEHVCKEGAMTVDRRVVSRALHTEVMMKSQGRNFIVQFLQSI